MFKTKFLVYIIYIRNIFFISIEINLLRIGTEIINTYNNSRHNKKDKLIFLDYSLVF